MSIKRPSIKTLSKLLIKYTDEELYKLYGFRKTSLTHWRNQLHIDTIINPIDIPDIIEHRLNGMSYIDLAYTYNTSVFVIECICRYRVQDSFKKIKKIKRKRKNLKNS